jgi:hypothetical protein
VGGKSYSAQTFRKSLPQLMDDEGSSKHSDNDCYSAGDKSPLINSNTTTIGRSGGENNFLNMVI